MKHPRVNKVGEYASEQWMYFLTLPDLYDTLAALAATGLFAYLDGPKKLNSDHEQITKVQATLEPKIQ